MNPDDTTSRPGRRTRQSAGPSVQELYALLIGIDQYLPNPLCEPLHGAVADADAMETLLLARGVAPANVVKLTASRGCGEAPAEPMEKRPTYRSMTESIRRLGRAAARIGGELLIHYSGHGCRTPTLIPSTKGADGLDEGLVPYDVASTGARIVRDVEFSYLLTELSSLGVPTLLIIDACHSGGILRDDAKVNSRGARCIDPVARSLDSELAPVAVLEASWRHAHRRIFASPASRGAAIPVNRPAASLIAACRDREAAYEFPFDGNVRGALTYALIAALGEGSAVPSWERLSRRVAHHIRGLGLHQTPVFEGEPSGVLVGMLRAGAPCSLRVVDFDPDRRRVLLDAGQALGLDPGARLEITVGTANGPNRATVLAEIEECGAGTAWARLCSRDVAAIEASDRAFVTDPGPGRRRRVQVASAPLPDGAPSARASQTGSAESPALRDGSPLGQAHAGPGDWLRAVERVLDSQQSGFLERVAHGQPPDVGPPDFRIILGPGDTYEVLQIDDRPVPKLPPLLARAPNAAVILADRLVHLTRFFTVRDLENIDRRSPLYGSLVAEIGRLPSGFAIGDDLEPAPCAGNLPRFKTGEWVCLCVANNSPQALQLYVISLEPDWAVQLLHPSRGLETLPSGQGVRLPFIPSKPREPQRGHWTFKVLATTRPTNVRCLELPAIDQPSAFDRAFRWVRLDPLEEFFAAKLQGAQTTGRSPLSSGASRAWITDQVAFEVDDQVG